MIQYNNNPHYSSNNSNTRLIPDPTHSASILQYKNSYEACVQKCKQTFHIYSLCAKIFLLKYGLHNESEIVEYHIILLLLLLQIFFYKHDI